MIFHLKTLETKEITIEEHRMLIRVSQNTKAWRALSENNIIEIKYREVDFTQSILKLQNLLT